MSNILKTKFEEWSQDAQAVHGRQQHLFNEDDSENGVVTGDPMVQELTWYHSITDAAIIEETKSVPILLQSVTLLFLTEFSRRSQMQHTLP